MKGVMDEPNFRFARADICDREAVYDLFEEEQPDIVVNFAAESHVDRSIENPGVFLQTNVIGTQVLLDACRASKASADLIVLAYHRMYGLPVYGKGENVRD